MRHLLLLFFVSIATASDAALVWLPFHSSVAYPNYTYNFSRAEGISNSGERVVGTTVYHDQSINLYYLPDGGATQYTNGDAHMTPTIWDVGSTTRFIKSTYVSGRGGPFTSYLGSGYAITSDGLRVCGSHTWQISHNPDVGEGSTQAGVWFSNAINSNDPLEWESGGNWGFTSGGSLYTILSYAKAISDDGAVRAGGFRSDFGAIAYPDTAWLIYWDAAGEHYAGGTRELGLPGEFRAVSGNGLMLAGRRSSYVLDTSDAYVFDRTSQIGTSIPTTVRSVDGYSASAVHGLDEDGNTAVGYDGYAIVKGAEMLRERDYYEPSSGWSVKWTTSNNWSTYSTQTIGDFVTRGPGSLPNSVASEAQDVSGDGQIVVGRALAYDEVYGSRGTRFAGYIWTPNGFGQLEKWLYVNDLLPSSTPDPSKLRIREVLDISTNGLHVCGVAENKVTENLFTAYMVTLPSQTTANKYVSTFATITTFADLDPTGTTVKAKYRLAGSTNSTPPITTGALYDSVGQFSLSIPNGNVNTTSYYDVYVKVSRHLSQKMTTKFDAFGNVSFPVTDGVPGLPTAVGGDCDNDDYVGTDDYLIVSAAFDTSNGEPGWDARADLDEDGTVSTDDYLIVSEAFDTAGDATSDGISASW